MKLNWQELIPANYFLGAYPNATSNTFGRWMMVCLTPL
jgi:hypothetical protein